MARRARGAAGAYRQGRWDLGELSAGPKSPQFARQVGRAVRLAKRFERHRGRLSPSMSQRRFMGMLGEVAAIHEALSGPSAYASLSYSADTQSGEATSLVASMSRTGSEIANRMLFFGLWWKTQVDEANARRLMGGAGELAGYLAHKRRVARYALGEPEERIINTLDVTGASALVKLYDKITGAFEYRLRVGGRSRTMTREELTNHVRSPRGGVRRAAYSAMLEKYRENIGVTGEIYRNIVLNWRDEGVGIRGYPSPISMRNVANDVEDGTVDSLLAACRGGAGTFRRFFSLKARMLGMGRLRRYDLYAPSSRRGGGARYTYARSAGLVLESFGRFSGTLEGFARRVFEESHIDSEVRRGKRDGAFCSTPSPRLTPYVLVNHTGSARDVFTLAHELGHAVHSMAAGGRSILVQDASLPLAETASTFSELLLYDSLSERVGGAELRAMLAEKIDDLYATILRQSFFTIFERDAHEMIGGGATADDLSRAYLANLRGQFGRSVEVSDDFGAEWSCIPHFYHSPFYCYAYSFGNLLALSLFQRYKREGDGFVPSYLGILGAGGSKKPEDLLSEHGFDITSPGFWQEGMDYVGGLVRDLSRM